MLSYSRSNPDINDFHSKYILLGITTVGQVQVKSIYGIKKWKEEKKSILI